LAHQVAGCFQPVPRVKIALEPQVGQLPERYMPSIQRAMAELKLKPHIRLKEAVKSTICWYSQVGPTSGKAIQK